MRLAQLQQLVDRTILQADKDGDGMISFEEFREVRRINTFERKAYTKLGVGEAEKCCCVKCAADGLTHRHCRQTAG